MSTSALAPRTRRHIAPVSTPGHVAFPARVRAAFSRLCGRLRDPAWALSQQPDHLLAYATWGEMLLDPERTAGDR